MTKPDEPVEVVASLNGVEHARVKADLLRSDLKRLGEFGNGHHGFTMTFEPPLAIPQSCVLTVAFASTGEALPNGTHVLSLDGEARARALFSADATRDLSPVFVTGIGRSGTTLLMQKLSLFDAVAVAPKYPFEVKLATYYAQALRILSAPADHDHSLHPDQLDEMTYHLGFNPYFDAGYAEIFSRQEANNVFFESVVRQETRSHFRALLQRYYSGIVADQERGAARYFAEKAACQPHVQEALVKLFDTVKSIVIVRDLRDVYCSSKAYFAADQRTRLIADLVAGQRAILSMTARSDVLVIRYENLIEDASRELARIATFLGVEQPLVGTADGVEAHLFKIHGTSSDVAASIGRWRRDLSASDQIDCNERFAPFLERFGYASF